MGTSIPHFHWIHNVMLTNCSAVLCPRPFFFKIIGYDFKGSDSIGLPVEEALMQHIMTRRRSQKLGDYYEVDDIIISSSFLMHNANKPNRAIPFWV